MKAGIVLAFFVLLFGCFSAPDTTCGEHSIGDSWKSSDMCNTCSCTKSGAACTEMACLPSCGGHGFGDKWIGGQGNCNECTCTEKGIECSIFACSWAKKIIWRSSPQGDFQQDTRDPKTVCEKIEGEGPIWDCVKSGDCFRTLGNEKLNCTLAEYKPSYNSTECADGISIAGCFACKFECSYVEVLPG